jgi:exodeoxyribonuclease VII large subunit
MESGDNQPKPPLPETRKVYSVSTLNREARQLVEDHFGTVWVEGEISNLARPSSGHLYWSMKDENSQLRCAMFRQKNRVLKFSPKNGQQILAQGRLGIYESRGEFQLVVDYLEEAGEGLLRRRFDELKNKLDLEGLFDADKKRALPRLPRKIGVITSPSGAAVRDVLSVLARRFPAIPVLVYPTAVQGDGASDAIAHALNLANQRRDCDLLILTRGGGSLEDLWSFNEEVVARAIASIEIPIIVGVGHEIDFTIADFVADVRAPTPSGAAELAVPDKSQWLNTLTNINNRLSRAIDQHLSTIRQLLDSIEHRMSRSHPGVQLGQSSQRLDEMETRLRLSLERSLTKSSSLLAQLTANLLGATPRHLITSFRERLKFNERNLDSEIRKTWQLRNNKLMLAKRALQSVSPLATLKRGYAIVTNFHGKVIKDASTVSPGTSIDLRLASGKLSAIVKESHQKQK